MAHPALAQPHDALARAEAFSDAGQDEGAETILRAARQEAGTPRLAAAHALVLMRLERWAEAEHALSLALAGDPDPWVSEHREALREALHLLRARVVLLTLAITPPRANVTLDGVAVDDRTSPFSIDPGPHRLVVSAPGYQTHEQELVAVPGQAHQLAVVLEASGCEDPAMVRIDGGGCCWPGQRWESAELGCSGPPQCPAGLSVTESGCAPEASPLYSAPRTRGFRFSLFGGVTHFVRDDSSLFRPRADAGGEGLSYGVNAGMRMGYRLHRFFALEIGGGVAVVQPFEGWPTVAEGTSPVNADSGDALTYSAGIFATFHTRPDGGGAFDLVFGAGFEPLLRMRLVGDTTSTVAAFGVPLELGFSLFAGDVFSFDFRGQYRIWLPQEVCATDALTSQRSCATGGLRVESAWAATFGFSLQI
ncbi:MAG: hypothetical protein H6726_19070 [Sandaracinaceae bacterium]|nr:hypothetical protein [Sandaracinaceae bacterium]